MPYIGAGKAPGRPRVMLWGAPFDATTSFRSGARSGPGALRKASDGLETYSPDFDLDLEDYPFADRGDVALPPGDVSGALARLAAEVEAILAAGALPFLLGGEHLASLPAIAAVAGRHPELVVVQVDGHADLREEYLGATLSHSTVMRRVLDHVPVQRLRQIGIRSGTRPEWEFMRAHGTLVRCDETGLRNLRDWIGARPVYFTVDLDGFDPAFFPGTGTPEPGGLSWHDFAALVAALRGARIVGLDAMELSPALDPTGASAVLAAKAVREMLLLALESGGR